MARISDFVKEIEELADNEYFDDIRTASKYHTPTKTGFYVLALRSYDEPMMEDHSVIKKVGHHFLFGPAYWSAQDKSFHMSIDVWWDSETDEVSGNKETGEKGDTFFSITPDVDGFDSYEEEDGEVGETGEDGKIIYYPFVKHTWQVVAMYQIDEFTFTGRPVVYTDGYGAELFGELD